MKASKRQGQDSIARQELLIDSAELIVETRGDTVRWGTAFQLNKHTVITAYHVLHGEPDGEEHLPLESVWARFAREPQEARHNLKVVWESKDDDIALLRFVAPKRERRCRQKTIHARPLGLSTFGRPCWFVAFPQALLRDEGDADKERRSAWVTDAFLRTGTEYNTGRIPIQLNDTRISPIEESRGSCGAAIVFRNDVVAVLTEFHRMVDRYATGREVWHLLKDQKFRRIVLGSDDAPPSGAPATLEVRAVFNGVDGSDLPPNEQLLRLLEQHQVKPELVEEVRQLLAMSRVSDPGESHEN